jgi:hypothetical protein
MSVGGLDLRLLEEGIWSAQPQEVWELELRLSERQGAEFRLLAPDEPAARAAFEDAHPDRVATRTARIAKLKPDSTLFDTSAHDEDGEELDDDDSLVEDEDTA